MGYTANETITKEACLPDKAMPAPRTARELFELFRQYQGSDGINGFAHSFDWSGVTPQQIYWLILQRLPKSARVVRPRPDYSAREHANAALLGLEFQRSIVKLVANAYSEKRRLIHVHIQKTAGLDLRAHLSRRLPSLPIPLSQDEITSKETLFAAVKEATNRLQKSNSLYIGGHRELSWYLQHSLYRLGDRLFAVVRHPHDIIISYINFILGRFVADPQLSSYDTRNWASVIGLEKLPDLSNTDNIIQISSKLLLTRSSVIRPNFLATYLGNGTADSAFELMARTNIEITDITRYKSWLAEAWGIQSSTQINRSMPMVKFETLSAVQQEYIRELCEEDMLLYPKIMKALDKRTVPYTFGAEILG